jgi:L-amino acid N-acyltransferase YncA
LEKVLAAQNITNVNACIASPETDDEYLNHNSIQFHQHLGYSMIGEFHKCAYKFGRWYNMVWMEKMIGSHHQEQPAMIPFPEVTKL